MHRLGLWERCNLTASLPEPCRLEIEGRNDEACEVWLSLGAPYAAALALMSAREDDDVVDRLIRALNLLECAGATGTIVKPREFSKNYTVIDELPRARRGPRRISRQHPLGLTAREQEIMPVTVEGLSNKEISNILSRSPRTVENHVASILRKLNVGNRMEVMLRVTNEL